MESTTSAAETTHSREGGSAGYSAHTSGDESRYVRLTDETRRLTSPESAPRTKSSSEVTERRLRRNAIDAARIAHARRVLSDIDRDDPIAMQLAMSALIGCVMEMWESAERCSQYHQDILAALETAVRSASYEGVLTDRQVDALEIAIHDLSTPEIVAGNAESVREHFVSVGFPAMPFLE